MAFYVDGPIGGYNRTRPVTEEDSAITWEDYGRAALNSGGALVRGAASGAEWVGRQTGIESLAEGGAAIRRDADRRTGNISEGLTPQFKRTAGASFLPSEGEDSVFDVGLGSYLGAMTVGSAASLVAAVVPAFAVARGVAALGGSRALAATAGGLTARGTESSLVAGDVAASIFSEIEKMDHDELMEIPAYAGFISLNMSEQDARAELMKRASAFAPVAAFAAASLTGGMESGLVGKAVGRAVSGGVLRGAARGARNEAIEEGIQSGAGEAAVQGGLASAGIGEMDYEEILASVISGTFVGAGMGGPVGAVSSIGGSTAESKPTPKPNTTSSPTVAVPATGGVPNRAAEANTQVNPNNASPSAREPATPPNQTVPVGDPQNKVVGSTRQGKKAQLALKGGKVTLNPEIGPDITQAQALPAAPVTQPGTATVDPNVAGPEAARAMENLNRGPVPEAPVQPQPEAVAPEDAGRAMAALSMQAAPDAPSTAVSSPASPTPAAPAPAPGGPATAPLVERIRSRRGGAAAAVAPAPVVEPVATPQVAPTAEAAPAPERRVLPRLMETLPEHEQELLMNARIDEQDRFVGNAKWEKSLARAGQGKNWGKKLAERKATNEAAIAAVEASPRPPLTQEEMLAETPEATVGRAVAMTEAAKDLKLPKQKIMDATNKEAQYNPHVMLLVEARKLAKFAGKKKVAPALLENFRKWEMDVRTGYGEDAKSDRRGQGEAANRVSQGDVDTLVDTGTNAWTDDEAAAREADEDAQFDVPETTKSLADAGAEVVGTERLAEEVQGDATPVTDKGETVTLSKKDVLKEDKPNARITGKDDVETKVARSRTGPVKVSDGTKRDKDTNAPITRDVKGLGKIEDRSASAVRSLSAEEKAAIAARLGTTVTQPSKAEAAKATSKARATPKQRVAAEAKKVDPNPTPAQIEQGNYAKGHPNLLGLRLTIETKKGGIRRSHPDDPVKWEVKMPAHYGEIKGTEGMDGDPVDAYIGDNLDSPHVFVVDQVHADSKEPDEHKVFIGFNNAVQVMEVYEGSFSDKRGFERWGGMTPMSVPEFKEWLANRKATKQPLAEAVLAEVDKVEARAEAPEGWGTVDTSVGREPVPTITDADARMHNERALRRGLRQMEHATHKGKLSELLKFTKSGVEGLSDRGNNKLMQALYPEFSKRISNAAGETPYYVIPDEVFDADPDVQAYYLNGAGAIFFRESLLEQGMAKFAHVALHEGVHAAFVTATWENPAIQNDLGEILAAARAAFQGPSRPYGLANIDELVAEAISNPQFQSWLATVEAPKAMIERHKLDDRIRNLWDLIVNTVQRALGLPKAHGTLLHAVLRVSSRLELGAVMYEGQAMSPNALRRKVAARYGEVDQSNFSMPSAADVQNALTPTGNSARMLGWRTLDQIAQMSKDFFGGNGPVRKIADLVENIRVRAIQNLRQSEPVILALQQAQRSHTPEQWEEFTNVLYDETMTGVYGDRPLDQQKHLGVDSMSGAWARAQHAELSARWNALPDDLKALRTQAMDFFTAQQNAMSLSLINNRLLKMAGIEDTALARRIHTNSTTDADKALVGEELIEKIEEAGILSKIAGPYFPLMRRGNFVVQGVYKVTPPSKFIRQLEDNTFEFATADEAKAYAEKQSLRPTIKTVYVDPTTGERFGTGADGKQVRLTSKDVNAETRYRVTVQDRHVEFFENKKDANEAVAQYEADPAFASVTPTQERRYEPTRNADMLNTQMTGMLNAMERREGFKNLTPLQQSEVSGLITEAGIRMLGSTRIQTRRLKRQYVAGASRDLTRNSLLYAQSTSGYLARLELQPQLDEAIKALDTAIKSGSADKNKSLARSQIRNEIVKRVEEMQTFEDLGVWGGIAQRIMTVSFLDKLFSPAYNIVNALQPAMLTLPTLAAEHGAGKAGRTLMKAYDDIGAGAITRQGISGTVRAARDRDAPPVAFIQQIVDRLKDPGEKALFARLIEVGTIDPDAGLELDAIVNAGGVMGQVDRHLAYFQGISRQMPRAIESINRSVSALAAYRLEMAKSGNHDKALLYAQETTNMTQGVYSHTNAAPIFNHPFFRLSLQFKKHGQLVYGLIGHQVGRAIRNENAGDRAQAIKVLTYIAAAHVAMAGALGLPTEPFKWLVIGANIAGLTEFTWADVENAVREKASDLVGTTAGEMLTRGVTRGLPGGMAIDLSGRVGMADLLTFGEPRSNDPQDTKAYLMEQVLGAPGGLMVDWLNGANKLASGDFWGGIEKIVPAKIASDAIRAYRSGTEGKKTAAGYESLSPYSMAEAGLRVLGFTPGREAEVNEQRNYMFGAQARQSNTRNGFMHSWAQASGSERAKLWGQIERWNKGKSKDERLTRAQLDQYMKRRKSEKVQGGFRMTKQNTPLYNRTLETYNVR